MMGWTPRPTASMCQSGGAEHHLREASVSEVSMIGLDISKHVFHAHGVDGRGRAMFRRRISRGTRLDFSATEPSCTVALPSNCTKHSRRGRVMISPVTPVASGG